MSMTPEQKNTLWDLIADRHDAEPVTNEDAAVEQHVNAMLDARPVRAGKLTADQNAELWRMLKRLDTYSSASFIENEQKSVVTFVESLLAPSPEVPSEPGAKLSHKERTDLGNRILGAQTAVGVVAEDLRRQLVEHVETLAMKRGSISEPPKRKAWVIGDASCAEGWLAADWLAADDEEMSDVPKFSWSLNLDEQEIILCADKLACLALRELIVRHYPEFACSEVVEVEV